MTPPETATVERLTVYPIKSLDGRSVETCEIVDSGGLAGDREYALFDADGEYVNGKRERRVHPLKASYNGDGTRAESITLSTPSGDSRRFDLASETSSSSARSATRESADNEARESADNEAREPTDDEAREPTDDEARKSTENEASDALTDWLTEWFGYPVALDRNRAGGFPDDTTASGPTIISTATIETVAGWFDGIDSEGMRRRLRANVEVGGVPAFWEDRLFADRAHRVAFTVGGVAFRGHNPCQRCVVPTRDPETGESYPGFQSTFVERRAETMPAWSGGDWFDHDFRLMVNTSVPESGIGETLSVGDEVVIGETVPADDEVV